MVTFIAEEAGLEPTHRIGYRLLVVFKTTALPIRLIPLLILFAEMEGVEPTTHGLGLHSGIEPLYMNTQG